MKIIELSIKNSLLVNLISVFILLAGVYSMFKIQREAFPAVSYDIVTVSAVWPGAPTEDVEKFVTIPLEEEIGSVSGLQDIDSRTDEGVSTIGVTINPGISDKRKVVNDIQRAVDRVKGLPDEVEDPEVFELATREFPIIEISISGAVSEKVRRQYAESLKDQLLDIDGVSQVNEIGWRDYEFWVEVDPKKLTEYYVSLQEIMDALQTRNVTVPGGQLTADDKEFNVRTTGEFKTAEEIGEVIIRANDSGNWLRVKDVAKVKESFEDPTTIAKVNGENASAMVVVKTEQADAIKVVDLVKEQISLFEKKLPANMEIKTANDFSFYVKRRLGVLTTNGMIGFLLVLFILFCFLDPIPAFLTAMGIPIALCITFILMSMLGISINLVSMLGIILVLGMLVDDGIVISENVYRYIEQGLPVREATLRGASEVMAPVTFTILTTFSAFAPLMFMDDIIGKFVRQIPIVVIITLTASLFEAFIILPSHLFDAFRIFGGKTRVKKEKKWYGKVQNLYKNALNSSLNWRYGILIGMIIVFAFSIWIVKHKMKILMFAGEGIEYFWIRAEAPKGTPLEKMNTLLLPVEDLVSKLPASELDSFRTYIGSIESEQGFDPNAKRGTHLAQITVFLTPAQKRDRQPREIMDDIRKQLNQMGGFEKLYTLLPKEGPPTGADVEVGIRGEDYAVMEKIAAPFVEFLKSRKGVSDVNTSYDFGKKQLKVIVDEEQAKKYYLTIGQIAMTVRNVFKGGVATTIKPEKADEEINVVVRFPESERNRLDVFDEIYVPNSRGNLVKLNSVARVEESEGVYLINHFDGKRVLYVTAQVDNKQATSFEVNHELQKKFKNASGDFLGYTIKYGGEFEDQQKSMQNLMASYLFALFLIFILLVAEFRSLIQPFIVMVAIPFGIIGVILSFWVHDMILPSGRPLNFFAMMGLVGLTGIVINDSLVLMDFINRLRKEGKPRRESLIEAGLVRLRPIIMTSVTTIGGLVSVAYGIGGGDPFLKPMALAIVWGLTFSTILTLIGIPCIYAIFDDFSTKVLRRSLVQKEDSATLV
ncbi:MAG: efflux RND transporter permease subunit [Candidatus Omnitrophota bacterium]